MLKSVIRHICRLFNNVNYKEKFYNNKIINLECKDQNIYFGYFDHPSSNNGRVLYIENDGNLKNESKILIYDISKNEHIPITTTKAWNYQMGCRLRWIDSSHIIYNNFENNNYISVVYDVNNKKVTKKYTFPIYDITENFENSLFVDFDILNFYRPGYGYNKKKCVINNETYKNNGVFIGNFKTNESKLLISIEEIISLNEDKYKNSHGHYINHISCSKFESKLFFFFHLWTNDLGILKNEVVICDCDGRILNIIDDFIRASHYAWKNKNEILLTVLDNGICTYRLYNIYTGLYKSIPIMNVDGHPSYINDKLFITDTYPDHSGMQHIYLCNENRVIRELVQIYHNPKKINEYRCDLHPRYENKILTFDCCVGKNRKEIIMEIDLENEKLDNYEEYGKKYKKEIFKKYSHMPDVGIKSYLIESIFGFSFKAHILVYKMLHCNNDIHKLLMHNKLQSKYSMWISSKCQIANDIHFMHLDGITIGSGVKIGKGCTIYQQVTIGKEKGGFPTIGNDVTIYSGAKIFGDIVIGDNSVIGANAVVIHDVPENSVAVGIPAKILNKKKDIDINE